MNPSDQLLQLANQLVTKTRTLDTVRVRIDHLNVDHDYQRPLDRDKVKSIHLAWKQGANLAPIECNQRPDGTLWITDGQHRAAAAALAGETHIPAYVRQVPQREEAALTNIMAKIGPDQEQPVIAALLGNGGRRDGKRISLDLGGAGRVTYFPYGDTVAKGERGLFTVDGGEPLEVVKALGLDSFPHHTETAV